MIQYDGHPAAVYSLAFSPDASLLASGGKDGTVRFWDAGGGLVATVPTSDVPDESVRSSLSWSASGAALCGHQKGLVEVRPTGEVRAFGLPLSLLPVHDFGHLTDDLLAVGGGGFVRLFDLKTNAPRPVQKNEQKAARRLVVSRATKTVAWTNGEHRLRVWPTTSPDTLDVPLGKPSFALAMSPDGTRIAVGVDYAVRLYQTGVRHPAAELTGHKGRVSGAAFSADGRILATASWDETVRLWDVATARETTRFPLKIGALTAVAFSPDGTRLAVAGTAGPIVLIDAE
jgi:WD40 repeat protein